MKNRGNFTKIACFSIITGIVLCVSGWTLAFFGGRTETGYDGVVYEEITEYKSKKFNSIRIDANAAEVEIVETDRKDYGYEIRYASGLNKKNTKGEVYIENDTLMINLRADPQTKGFNIFPNLRFSLTPFGIGSFNFGEKDFVKVYVPQGASVHSITADTISGHVAVSGIAAESIMLDGGAATDYSLSDLYGSDLSVQTVSGNVYLEGCAYDKITADSVSGDIIGADYVKTNGAYFSTISGEIKLTGSFAGETELSSVSGDIIITTDLPKPSYSYDFSSVSGKMQILEDMPESADGGLTDNSKTSNRIIADTVSGNFMISFTGKREN